jgi:predicted RNase H-like nuclease (RuvC/YqgF family)
MNPRMLKTMKAKQKRPVDPNAPPRPNLMSHDKVIRDQKATIENLGNRIGYLEARLDQTESKLRYQTQYLSQLHNNLQSYVRKK